MKPRHLLTCLAAPLLLTQCVVVDPNAPGYPPNPPSEGPHRSTYRSGRERGHEDGSSGRSRNPRRHYGSFPAAETSAFNAGYEAGYDSGMRQTAGPGYPAQLPDMRPIPPSYGAPLRAETSRGAVTIREGPRTLTSFVTAGLMIEETRFINEQQQIVVKSRSNHGPATVQLFNARNGREEARVMAYGIRNGRPAWAVGMGD